MAIRSPKQQNKHSQLVTAQVRTYENSGFQKIKADHIGHPNGAPKIYNGYRPDVTAEYSTGRLVICEAETEDTIDLQETLEQVKAFERAATMPRGELHMIVPEEIYENALDIMYENDIEVFQWWTVRFR